MAVVFYPNQELTDQDLNIFVKNSENELFDPYSISYTIEDSDGNPFVTVCETAPEKAGTGYYWANITIPHSTLGTYTIKWKIKDFVESNFQLIEQRFGVVQKQDVGYTPTIGGVVYYPGQPLSEKDLYIFIRNHLGNLADPYTINYEVFQRVSGVDVLISSQQLVPVKLGVGHYYANYQIPETAIAGDYFIRWIFQNTPNSAQNMAIQEFAVVDGSIIIESPYTDNAKGLIRKLRYLLRDNNPDRNYHFMPPASEETIQGFTQKFGYVWTDDELFEYIDLAISDINNRPPREEWSIDTLESRLNALALNLAAANALRALAINWAHEEWSGDISGVGLSIEKSSKYLSIKENFESAYTSQIETHKEFGVRYIRGVRQPRHSVGVTSALGPYSKVGVQSRRNYIGMDRPMFP